jgi:hypothetical protein
MPVRAMLAQTLARRHRPRAVFEWSEMVSETRQMSVAQRPGRFETSLVADPSRVALERCAGRDTRTVRVAMVGS